MLWKYPASVARPYLFLLAYEQLIVAQVTHALLVLSHLRPKEFLARHVVDDRGGIRENNICAHVVVVVAPFSPTLLLYRN